MKTQLTSLAVLIAIVFCLTSCDKEKVDQEEAFKMTEAASAKFFETNIAIVDARVRSINKEKYVREFYLANFSERDWDKKGIVYENYIYLDNGQGNDLIANDGVYTSEKIFHHTTNVPYIEDQKHRSVLKGAVTSSEFAHHNALIALENNYNVEFRNNGVEVHYYDELEEPVDGFKPTGNIKCKFKVCSTGCLADYLWSELGCICFYDCEITIGW